MAFENMVVMGRIVAPYGVYGWLKVVPDTEYLDGLLDYEVWWIGKAPNWRETSIEQAKIHNDVLLVKLVGVSDRDAAFALKGQQIAVPREALPEPDEGEYYWSDLIGLHVRNTEGVDFGKITQVLETGANDVLVVRELKPTQVKGKDGKLREEYRERLIPFTSEAVPEVDVKAGTVLVDWDADF
ncbi:ribosome maturation factor RimM [Methylophilus sp. TWE2]|nr:ribosome maturation factor RimM [Methylophilus sp. TWE2]